jgi:hypothetical protein
MSTSTTPEQPTERRFGLVPATAQHDQHDGRRSFITIPPS